MIVRLLIGNAVVEGHGYVIVSFLIVPLPLPTIA